MNLQEEYNSIADFLRANVKDGEGNKLTKEGIAKRLNLSRGHFSKLLGGAELKQFHIVRTSRKLERERRKRKK